MVGGRNPGTRGGGQLAGPAARNNTSPVWLLQFIDPTIEPNYSYRYRVRLKVHNPNFRRPDVVAYPGLAQVEELESPWYEIPTVVFAPPEEYLYAQGNVYHDKSEIGGASYDLTVLRFHRWFPNVRISTQVNALFPVGDWVVADIEARRGQYVHQTRSFRMPIWSMKDGNFTFAGRISLTKQSASATRQAENISVDFTPSVGTLLVDFEGGGGNYRLPGGVPPVADECAAEILLVTDDGKTLKVTSRNTAADSPLSRPDRDAREKTWKAWQEEVIMRLLNPQRNSAPGGG